MSTTIRAAIRGTAVAARRAAVLAVPLACALPLAAQAKVLVGNSTGTRESASFFYYSQQPFTAHGVVELTYGAPAWRDEYLEQLAEAKPGTRVRLGSNFWTTFDTSVPFEFDGGRIDAGMYYLAVDVGEDEQLSLVLLDAKKVRDQKLIAGQTPETKGGVQVPMAREDVDRVQQKLKMELVPDQENNTKLTVSIHFGPVKAQAVLYAQLKKKPGGDTKQRQGGARQPR